MSSGHGLRPLVWLTWALCASAWSVTIVHAQPRVVCVDPHDAELVARIRGQSRDLPLQLQFVAIDLPATPSLAEFGRVARARAADFVVKLRPSSNGSQIVYVYDAERSQLRVRKAPRPARRERFSRSAAAETIALIVRGELNAALSATEAGGRDATESAPAAATDPAPAPAVDAPPDRGTAPSTVTQAAQPEPVLTPQPPARATKQEQPAAVPEPDKPTPLRASAPRRSLPVSSQPHDVSAFDLRAVSISAGIRGASAGAQRDFLSPELAVQLRFAPVVLGLRAHTSLQNRVRSDHLSVALRQHALVLEVLGRLALGSRLELDLGAGAGAVMVRRTSTTDADATWQIEPAHSAWSAELQAVAALRWAFAQHFGVSVRIGTDLVLRPLRFVTGLVADPRASAEVSHLRVFEPWAGVCLFLDL